MQTQIEAFNAELNASKPVTAEAKDVVITIRLESEIMNSYVEEVVAELATVQQIQNGVNIITEDELRAYIQALIVSRVDYVTKGKALVHPTDSIFVPSFVSLALTQIGNCEDKDGCIYLHPEVDGEALFNGEPVNRAFMERISRALRVYTRLGLEGTPGYSRDKNGDYTAMMIHVLDGMIRSHEDSAPPAQALVAGFLNLLQTENLFYPKIVYGSVNTYKAHVTKVARLKQA